MSSLTAEMVRDDSRIVLGYLAFVKGGSNRVWPTFQPEIDDARAALIECIERGDAIA